MTKAPFLCAAVSLAFATLSPAKDFPLQFKTLDAREAMGFPGGSGAYGMVQFDKPSAIHNEPPAISQHPLYGQMSLPGHGVWFRLDESKGDGTGYDRLIVDVNQNGDLTDDAVVERVEEPQRSRTTPAVPQNALFGPIQASETSMIGGKRPVYFAQMYLYATSSTGSSGTRPSRAGQVRWKPGWYLETTVDLDGIARKVAIVDGNCNLQLGDASTATIRTAGSESTWYFQSGDCFLQTTNGSGKYTSSAEATDPAPFGPVLYLGAKPYKATLSADSKVLALDAWSGPLAELALKPQPEHVSTIQLAWETAPDKWQLLKPGIKNGKIAVPAGSYRLYSCTLRAATSDGGSMVVSGYKRSPKDTVVAKAGATVPFLCGAPLDINVSSQRARLISSSSQGAGSIVGLIASALTTSDEQVIRASVLGAGGELYSSFQLRGDKQRGQPARPVFHIVGADGKELASDKMEFG